MRIIFFLHLICCFLTEQAGAFTPNAFPNPQFERKNWQNLDGSWNFAFDDQNIGASSHWEKSPLPNARLIQVPFPFESRLSGIHDSTEHPYSWYQKTISIPREWQNKKMLLHFGAVHYHATVWLNGEWLGEHTGGQTPFEFELPSLTANTNTNTNTNTNITITIRCEHPPEDPYIARGKQAITPTPSGIYYTRSSGIWQSVWLEAVGENSLANLHFVIDLQGEGSVKVSFHHPSHQQKIILSIKSPTKNNFNLEQTITDGALDVLIPLKIINPALWSPEHPQLYEAEFSLIERETTLDKVATYFGIREIKTQKGDVLLNGKNLYLKFILDQGFWPDGIWSAPNEAALLQDIKLTQAMGFNGVRKHQKMEDPRFLYLADQLGLLVSSEFASPSQFSESSSTQFLKEWREGITRDWNHPSIIMWVPANESWGYPNIANANDQQQAMRAGYQIAKSMDPTRLVIDNDGWQHSDLSDLFALHDYAHNGDDLYKDFIGFQASNNPPITIPYMPPALLPGYHYNASPLYLSEFAGIGYLLPSDTAAGAWGYQGLEPDVSHALGRLQSLYAALKRLPNIHGFCLTQLTDVEQEVNGLVTFHRVPKYEPAEIKKLNDSLSL